MTKITDLTAMISPDNADEFPIVDVDDSAQAPSGTTKKMNLLQLGTLLGPQVDHNNIQNNGTYTHLQIDGHINDTAGNPHAVTHAQTGPAVNEHVDHSAVSVTAGDGLQGGGDLTATRNFAVGAGNGITVNPDTIQVNEAALDHNTIANRTNADAHPISAITGLDAALGTKLENVVEDTTPQLGGDLETKGSFIRTTRGDNSLHGLIGAMTSTSGAAMVYSTDGTFDQNNGGVTVEAGVVNIYGTSVTMPSLKHGDEAQQVLASPNGILYSAPMPEPTWTESDTDPGDYDLGTGTGAGTWTQLTGLQITTPAEIQAGERVDVSIRLYAANKTAIRTGDLEVYLSVAGDVPTGGTSPDDTATISANFAGTVNFGFFDVATGNVPASTLISVYARINNGSQAAFGLDLLGSVQAHSLVVSRLGEGGSGGSGDVVQGTGGATGEVAVWQDFAGKLVHGTGIPAAQLPRLDAENVYTGAGVRYQILQSTDGAVGVQLFPGNAAPDGGRISFVAGAGSANFQALDDAGGFVRTVLDFQHDGDVDVPSGTLTEQNINVTYPAELVIASGTWNPDFRAGASPHVTLTGDVTISTPTVESGSGVIAGVASAGTNITVTGGYLENSADRDNSGAQHFVVHRTGVAAYVAWGNVLT